MPPFRRDPPALLVLAVALALAGCGGGRRIAQPARPAALTSYAVHGIGLELPRGWQHAATSLTPHLVDPRERLAVATYTLRYRSTGCAQVPGSALEDLGPRDAFITLQERGRVAGAPPAGFPPRPAHFGPLAGGPSEAGACVPTARFDEHWLAFSDAGRRFYALIAFGPRASASTRAQAWGILDGLRVDPRVLPNWRSSG